MAGRELIVSACDTMVQLLIQIPERITAELMRALTNQTKLKVEKEPIKIRCGKDKKQITIWMSQHTSKHNKEEMIKFPIVKNLSL